MTTCRGWRTPTGWRSRATRGEFIHVQCLLSRMGEDDPRRPELEERSIELLARRHQEEWLGPLHAQLCWGTFRRGFLDTVRMPAAEYVGYALTQTLPPTVRRVEVDLTGHEVPRDVIEYMPEAIARENIILPLAFDLVLVLAMPDPRDAGQVEKLAFILGRDVMPVAAPRDQIIDAINRHYGSSETESVDSILVDWAAIDLSFGPDIQADESPVNRLVALIITEAIAVQATEISIIPQPDHVQVRFRVGHEWADRDAMPRRIAPIVVRIREMAGLPVGPLGSVQTGLIGWTVNGDTSLIRVVIWNNEGAPC